jgi:hypothetical protein
MSKKPAAALSANLVAIKGTAAPASDMPGRAAAAAPSLAVVPAVSSDAGPEPQPRAGQGEVGGQPLNFRVPDTFRREFKVYAAQHGLKLNELLRLSFDAYRRQNGD